MPWKWSPSNSSRCGHSCPNHQGRDNPLSSPVGARTNAGRPSTACMLSLRPFLPGDKSSLSLPAPGRLGKGRSMSRCTICKMGIKIEPSFSRGSEIQQHDVDETLLQLKGGLSRWELLLSIGSALSSYSQWLSPASWPWAGQLGLAAGPRRTPPFHY